MGGGDGASTHAHLIAVLFKTEPIRQKVSYFKGLGDGASRHAHFITVLFKTQPIRQEVSCFMGASGMGMVLANMQTRSIIFHRSGGMVLADMPT